MANILKLMLFFTNLIYCVKFFLVHIFLTIVFRIDLEINSIMHVVAVCPHIITSRRLLKTRQTLSVYSSHYIKLIL